MVASSPLDLFRPPTTGVRILESLQESFGDDLSTSETNILSPSLGSNETTESGDFNELDRFMGDSLLSFSFNPPATPLTPRSTDLGGSFVSAFCRSLNTSLNVPFFASPTKDKETTFLFPTVVRNPNKAILTIDAVTSVILIANHLACNLFSYEQTDLVGMKVQSLFSEPYRARQRALVEQNIDSAGETVLVSGKVVS